MNKLVFAALLLACSGCNTVAGLGKDIQAIGGVLAGTAQGAQAGTQPPARPASCARDAQGRLPAGCAS